MLDLQHKALRSLRIRGLNTTLKKKKSRKKINLAVCKDVSKKNY